MMNTSMLQIMNAALLSQGFEEIVAVEDGSDEFRIMARNWPQIVERELEDGRYHFTRQELRLNNRVDGSYGFPDAYLMPIPTLHVRSVHEESAGFRRETKWTQDATHIHTAASSGIIIEAFETPGVHLWSANFSHGVQKRLEAVLCLVKEDLGGAQAADAAAEVAFQRARTNSSKLQSPNPAYRPSVYAAARFRRA